MTRALIISAPSSGAGKTIVSLGLMRALRDAGHAVASAKSGPDYIDPAFHAAATGRPCATLDAWAMTQGELRARAQADAGDLLIVEGAMGLFDAAADGAGATADVAAALGAPVVLVLDAARMAQTAAAIVAGLAAHRPDVTVAGVILNRVGSARHEAMLRAAIPLPVLGAIPRDARLATPSRHLGLVQAEERGDLEPFIAGAAAIVAARCDLSAIAAAARPISGPGRATPLPPLGQRMAVARDIAFAFVYPHMLEDWRRAGAEITCFSPLNDESPGEADAVFLPGGYPELHAARLAAAATFRAGMLAAARNGALIYGECGGYMALGESLVDAEGAAHRMLGLLPLTTSFADRCRRLGYRRLIPLVDAPWSGPLMAHEHHQATTIRATGDPLFHATDALGENLGPIGLRDRRVMGSFAHVIAPAR